MKFGILTISDRVSTGVYADRSGPEAERLLRALLEAEAEVERQVVPDEFDRIVAALTDLCDERHCQLVVTTGGTGLFPRDITPEATLTVLDKELPGFGERMRTASTHPAALLSRALAGVRGDSLILNLPGNPRAVNECLPLVAPALRAALEHLRAGSSEAAHE